MASAAVALFERTTMMVEVEDDGVPKDDEEVAEKETEQQAVEERLKSGNDDAKTTAAEGAYPMATFQDWNQTGTDRYYVQAPIDRLGAFAFHLRSHIVSLILAGNPAIEYLQRRRTAQLTLAAHIFSWLGLETFFFALVASNLWLFDAKLGRLLALLMAAGFFTAGSLKVLLCLPRPPSPPAIELAKEDNDWAWPSNHALLGTAFPWFIWIYASNHYHMTLACTVLLLCAIVTWNVGVLWSRVYLGVHSPCDVLAGWTIGCFLLFVFSGFSDRLHELYAVHPPSAYYFVAVAALALYAHPRAWPETQSYGEVICVVVGALVGIWASRLTLVAGPAPPVSLLEGRPDAPLALYFLRYFTGCVVVAVLRALVKPATKAAMRFVYGRLLHLPFYSYSDYCKRVQQPTKRFTHRLRLRPIAGKLDDLAAERRPYDVDLPVKAIVYAFVGFLVGEGCPAVFSALHI